MHSPLHHHSHHSVITQSPPIEPEGATVLPRGCVLLLAGHRVRHRGRRGVCGAPAGQGVPGRGGRVGEGSACRIAALAATSAALGQRRGRLVTTEAAPTVHGVSEDYFLQIVFAVERVAFVDVTV
jgi:hypothetical protein